MFLVLVLGAIGTTWGMVWALDEQARVSAQKDRAAVAHRQVTDEFDLGALAEATEPPVVPIVDPT